MRHCGRDHSAVSCATVRVVCSRLFGLTGASHQGCSHQRNLSCSGKAYWLLLLTYFVYGTYVRTYAPTDRATSRRAFSLLRSELTRTAHKLSHMPASQGPRRSPVEPPCENGEMLDLVIIGAGPHALSLLGRLVEEAPDLLTERERVRIAHKAGSRAAAGD